MIDSNKLIITDEDINIVQLDFPDSVRKRPGKVIGSTDNPDVILREVIDNSIDELFGSTKADKIKITAPKIGGQFYVVEDSGRGIPIIWDEEKGKTKCELAIATLDAGSKFDKNINRIAVGMNGVGGSCTTALSEHYIILSRVRSTNYYRSIPIVKELYESLTRTEGVTPKNLFYYLEYKKGIKQDEGCITKEDALLRWDFKFEGYSTIVAFKPDPEIFKSVIATYPKSNMRYMKAITEIFYNKSVEITLNDNIVSNEFEPYKYKFIKSVDSTDYNGKLKEAKFFVSLELDSNLGVIDIDGSVNSLTVNAGLHIEFCKRAYSDALQKLFSLGHNYTLNGLRMNVITMSGEVDFASQTKERCTKLDDLTTAEVVPILSKEFQRIIKDNQDEFELHVLRLNEYADSLSQISTINKVRSMVVIAEEGDNRVRSKIPACVSDASTQNRQDAELYIVEGRSAEGTILKARDKVTQAVLSLRGVPMNSINVDLDTLLENEEMKNIISTIGAGVNEYFNVDSCRYGKIIIAADSDSDGQRIASLVAGMIARKMTFLIQSGMVYVLESPLYIQGDNYYYYGEEDKLDRDKPYVRLKGLGEINVDQAEVILTGKSTRRLKRLTLEGVELAVDLLTSRDARKQLLIDTNILIDPYNLGLWV